MQLSCLIIIMIIGAIVGGSVYFISPTNKADDGSPVIGWIKSVIFGLGATAIIPVLFVTTQSQLLDNIEIGKCSFCSTDSISHKKDTVVAQALVATPQNQNAVKDSSNKDTVKAAGTGSTASPNKPATNQSGSGNGQRPYNPATGYLLWFGYCVLAAAAGFGFIKSLISKVVTAEEQAKKDQAINTLNFKLDKAKNQNMANLMSDEQKAQTGITQINSEAENNLVPDFVWPVLPPATVSDDPQKGRFGGHSEVNGKKLQAEVTPSTFPGFYSVKLSVTTISGKPLSGDAVFFLHNSFSKIVRIVQAQNGIAHLEPLLAYGAFTVGVITDYGKTLLELDLSDSKLGFPKEFIER